MTWCSRNSDTNRLDQGFSVEVGPSFCSPDLTRYQTLARSAIASFSRVTKNALFLDFSLSMTLVAAEKPDFITSTRGGGVSLATVGDRLDALLR